MEGAALAGEAILDAGWAFVEGTALDQSFVFEILQFDGKGAGRGAEGLLERSEALRFLQKVAYNKYGAMVADQCKDALNGAGTAFRLLFHCPQTSTTCLLYKVKYYAGINCT